ncbi:hypothetical protein, partial [Salmonella sp. SAL4437]|uniref:hypothetical protein n=1 Tax=Salmonella sp. SAL4437 TaxID=3159892 RepID=UPI00397892B8
IYTLPDLIANMRDEIAARKEHYGRRVSFGEMTEERMNERLEFFQAVLSVLQAADAFRLGCDRAIVPPVCREIVPMSKSQRIAIN